MESLSLDSALHPANYGSLEVLQCKRLTRSDLYLFTRAALHFQRESQWWDLLQPSPGLTLLTAQVSVNMAKSKSLVGAGGGPPALKVPLKMLPQQRVLPPLGSCPPYGQPSRL